MYFNNAATTWPKPEVVYETLDRTFRSLNSPERTTSDEGARSDEMMSGCREELAAFFNIKDPRRLIFTPSATYSLNLAILGLDWRDGDVNIFGLSADPKVAMAFGKPLQTVNVESSVYATPIVANNVLYVATNDRLFAIQQEKPAAEPKK